MSCLTAGLLKTCKGLGMYLLQARYAIIFILLPLTDIITFSLNTNKSNIFQIFFF